MIPNRIVIDTNVCLDLFVFCDPRWHALLAALNDGSVEAVTRADCRMEWLIVLGYAHLQLDAAARARCGAEFDRLIMCLPQPVDVDAVRLPICRDPDDQKFLELARDAQAAVLITKDKALLKLAGKTRRAGLFLILPPQAWVAPSSTNSI
ncbi:putative PIN family toxin of toxin-antitoxin system [Actimicrobium sp. GrIS 1.19]|uniref:putative toxin-antitoxin system toxin component, PIN family n=1 Tax=Actimicrobium sp. GrIS 1.19 TaxID=3071708 RepID=UPI002E0B2040|nr:putative PIN family toxin of toxin-antitoxin system [Actimicrobium sp. GrIS 1.19]